MSYQVTRVAERDAERPRKIIKISPIVVLLVAVVAVIIQSQVGSMWLKFITSTAGSITKPPAVSVGTPGKGTAVPSATKASVIIIPTAVVSKSKSAGGGTTGAVAKASTPTSAPTEQPSPTPRPCILTTWPDGSQSCDDGTHIDDVHSKPGYCKLVDWDDGTTSCANGDHAGKIIRIDPEIAAEPTPTYWPAEPTNNVKWSSGDGPNNNTCVTVTFADQHTQTSCSDANVKLDANDAEFVARMIEDGRIKPGVGTPKG